MPGKDESQIPEAAVFTGTETGLVTQGGNSRRFNYATHLLPWLQTIFPMEAPGGGGGPMTFRTVAEEDWEQAPYPAEEFQGHTAALNDMNEGVIVPASAFARILGVPDDAEVGDTLRVYYGAPDELLGGSGSPPGEEPLIIGFPPSNVGGSLVVPLNTDFDPFALSVGDCADLQKVATVTLGPDPGIPYHIWKVVNVTRAIESTASSASPDIIWNPDAYVDDPDTGTYVDLLAALQAVQARGGGTLVVEYPWPTLTGGYYDASDVDIVFRPTQYEYNKGLLTIENESGFVNLRSLRGFRLNINGLAESAPAFRNYSSSGIVFYDCEMSTVAYPAVRPVVGEMRYVEFHGACQVGAGSIVAIDNPSAQLVIRATGATVIDAGAIASAHHVFVYLNDLAWLSTDQPDVVGGVTHYMDSAPRYIPVAIAEAATLTNPARKFYEVTPPGVDIAVAAPAQTDIVGSSGVSCYVAKRGSAGGNVVITGLTYRPGGGGPGSYTITDENDVVELIWLPGGVQVKP